MNQSVRGEAQQIASRQRLSAGWLREPPHSGDCMAKEVEGEERERQRKRERKRDRKKARERERKRERDGQQEGWSTCGYRRWLRHHCCCVKTLDCCQPHSLIRERERERERKREMGCAEAIQIEVVLVININIIIIMTSMGLHTDMSVCYPCSHLDISPIAI